MSRAKKLIITILVLLLLAGAGGGVYWYLHNRTQGASEDAVYVQNVGDLTGTPVGISNRYSGVVETQKTEKIQADSEKVIVDLTVAEGDSVKEGDPLFSYDTASIELDIQAGELEIERLNTTISNDTKQIAQLEKDMQKASAADKLGYSAQIQELQAEIATSEYNIKTKENEIEGLRTSLETNTVFAPITGTVTKVGDPKNPEADPDPQGETAFITILADGDLRIKGTVSEQSIYNISEGADVLVRSRVKDDQTWTGHITAIDTQQTETNENEYVMEGSERASKYPFYVDLDSTEGLMLGQHVTIELNFGQEEVREGLWLSSGFIVQEESGAYVWACKKDKKLEKRSVTLGDYSEDSDEYQIIDGLETSDYLAWPEEGLKAGLPTTTEYVFDENEFNMENMGGNEGFEGEMLDGGFEGEGFEGEMPEGEGFEGEMPEGEGFEGEGFEEENFEEEIEAPVEVEE